MNTETNPAGTMARLQAAEAELRRLREQEPVAYRYVYDDPFGRGGNVTSMRPTLNGCKPKESEPLYASPVPPPDVRELVEAGCNLHVFVDLFAGTDKSMRTAAAEWRAALAKHREQS